jgi:hypothetical protein
MPSCIDHLIAENIFGHKGLIERIRMHEGVAGLIPAHRGEKILNKDSVGRFTELDVRIHTCAQLVG